MPEIASTEIITIGSDPEMAIVTPQGRTIDADSIIKGNGDNPNCEFGFDGHSATAELRPKPATTPKQALANIKKILETNKKKYPMAYKNNLKAISNDLSLGGHIHFGHPSLCENPEVVGRLVTNLDNLLAFPLMYTEDIEYSTTRRLSWGYGKLSDYRRQNWGIEYRSLTSFLASKDLASIVFYTAYAIADATINHNFECEKIADSESFRYAYDRQARELLKPHLNLAFTQLITLPKYGEKEYKKEIDKFIEYVKAQKPLFNTEIKEGWNIDFDISDYLKLERIETLLEKITKLLIRIHLENIPNPQNGYKFAYGSFKDLGSPEIAKAVNIALNKMIDRDVIKNGEWQAIKVYGLREKRGNEIWIGRSKLDEKRRKRLLGYYWQIASNFAHKTKIEDIKFNKKAQVNSIGFGRKLREENLLMAETMTILYILLLNKDLYKNTEKIGKKSKALNLTQKKVVNPIVKILKTIDPKKFVVKPILPKSHALERIILPDIFDLNKSYDELFTFNLLELDAQDKKEISEQLKKVYPKLKKLQEKTPSMCTKNCTQIRSTPLIKLCKAHLLGRVLEIIEAHYPTYTYTHEDACGTCGEHKEDCACYVCDNCGKREQTSENFCPNNNDYCLECCGCDEGSH
jgi:hypothetical protein